MADLLLGVKIGVQGGPQSVKEIKAIDDQVRKLQEQNARVAATAKALSQAYDLSDAEVGQLIGELQRLENQTDRTTKASGALEIAIGNFGADLARRGLDVAIGAVQSLGQALTDAARQGLQTGQEFDTAAAKVNTLGVDSTALATEIQSLTGRLEGQANSVELLGSAYDVISAGFSEVSDVSGILEAATKGAVGGFSDTLTVADALTSTLQAYNLSADQAASLTDKFIQTQNAGKITVDQYAQQIGKVASIAAQAGVGIDELNGFIATATAQGVLVESAFTGIRQAIANTLKPSSESARFAKELGINFGATALQTQGLSGILGELNAKGLDSVENLTKLFGSVEAVAAIAPSAGAGFAQLTKNIDDGANSAGTADSAFSTMASTVERLQVAIGNQLTEGFLALGQALRPIQDAFIVFASSLLDATAEGVTGLDLITQAGERLQTVLQQNPQIAEQLGAALANLANIGIEQLARLVDGLSGFLVNADNIEVLVNSLSQVGDALQSIGDSVAFLSGVTNALVSLNRLASDLVPAFDGFLKVLTDIALSLTPLGQAASLGQSIVQTFNEVDDAIAEATQRVQGLIDRFLKLIGLPGFEAIARKIGLIDDSVKATFSGSGKDLAGNLTGAFDSLEKSAAALPENLAAISDAAASAAAKQQSSLEDLTAANQQALNKLEVQAAQAQEALLKSGGDPAKLAQAEKTSLEQRIAENKNFLESLKGLKGLEGEEAAKVADQIRQTELTLANDRVALARQVLDAKVKAAEEAAQKEVDALKKARDAEKEAATTQFEGEQTTRQDQFNDEERNRQKAFNKQQQNEERAFNESQRAVEEAFQKRQQAESKRFQAELDARRERGNREFDALGKEVDRRLQLQQASGSERAKLQEQFRKEDQAAKERRKIEQQVLNDRGRVLAGQGDLLELSPLEQARQQFEQGLQAEQEAFQLKQQEAERAFQEQQRIEAEAYQEQQILKQEEFDNREREIQRAFEAEQQAAEAAFNEQQRQLDEASAQRQAAILEAASRGIAPQVQARKDGGPVAAGQAYLVGEEGPELITPSRRGWVHTAGETAAMMSKQPTMLVKNPDMPGVEAKLSELLQEVRRGRRVAVPTSYTLNTVNPLQDAVALQIKQVRALARGRVL